MKEDRIEKVVGGNGLGFDVFDYSEKTLKYNKYAYIWERKIYVSKDEFSYDTIQYNEVRSDIAGSSITFYGFDDIESSISKKDFMVKYPYELEY